MLSNFVLTFRLKITDFSRAVMHESHNLKNPLVKCEGVQTRHTNNQDEQEDTVDTVQTVCSNVTGPEIRLCNVLLVAVQKAA